MLERKDVRFSIDNVDKELNKLFAQIDAPARHRRLGAPNCGNVL